MKEKCKKVFKFVHEMVIVCVIIISPVLFGNLILLLIGGK